MVNALLNDMANLPISRVGKYITLFVRKFEWFTISYVIISFFSLSVLYEHATYGVIEFKHFSLLHINVDVFFLVALHSYIDFSFILTSQNIFDGIRQVFK